jgi:catechol 2,3-dioxygenase-like lactoylglutathione lyase family enzyme
MSDASIFDHLSLRVSNYERAKRFYIAALKPLGITLMMEFPGDGGSSAGFGRGMPTLWIDDSEKSPQRGHVAFAAASRAVVDAFYKAALAAGATDNGAPGLRPHYHAHYYAAFIRDPDGHNIEAVTHTDPNAKPGPGEGCPGEEGQARREGQGEGKAEGESQGKSEAGRAPRGRAEARAPGRQARQTINTSGHGAPPEGRTKRRG